MGAFYAAAAWIRKVVKDIFGGDDDISYDGTRADGDESAE